MKHIWKSVIVALLLVLIAQTSLYSQTIALPGDGKDFFVGFMLPSYNKVAGAQTRGYYGAYLLISSYSDNKATVSYFDKTTGVETPGTVYSIAERTGIQVPINLQYVVLNDTGDVPEFGAIHITAKRPINIEFFSSGACSGGSFLPITTAGLGNRYVVASYKDNNGEMGLIGNPYGPTALELAHGFFEIIAPFDGTTVTITPNSLTLGGHHGFSTGAGATRPNEQPYTINLRRGQCYLVKSGTDDEGDLSGSIIESTKPVAVIAGHENAAVGGTSGRYLEGRDFMAEQMYPYDMWDTTGFVMIPLKDSYPSDPATYEGTGENYRVFAWDKVGSRVQLYDGCLSGPIDMTAGRLGYPPAERFQVSCPVDFEATNGKKFSVMMYDNRNFATKDPYPGPSMISVIPMSRWRTSFLWYVPANKFESLQSYFVNILGPLADFDGPNGILASFNGGTIKPLKQVLSLEQQWKTIPNFPGIAGVRFRLYPGSYYATGPHPFMVYNFGFRGLDPNNDLGDLDGDDFFFSYGLPVGVKLGSGTPHMRVVVDTSCASWNVCVYDTTFGLSNQGIKSITLLDDPHGDFTKPGKQFYNTRLDDSLDPDHLGEINMSGDDTNVCFKVLVNKPIDSAYAPLFIVDDQGNAIIVELFYQPPLVRLSPDSGRYFGLSLSTDSCSTFVFKNNGNKKSGKSFYFSSADLLLKNPAFKVTGTIPALPVSIGPGDSLIINACFTAKDTATQHDTIELVNDCFTEPIDLIGNGVIPQIIASDHDFGTVIKDSTKCDTVGVRNVGKAPFMLTTSWVLHNIVNFDFSDSSRLPMLLKPGQVVYLTFCYTPHSVGTDTTVQNWGTTLENPYKHSIKDTSILRGKGVKTGFVWDRTVQQQTVTCEDTDIVRVHLLNNAIKGSSNIPAHVDSIYFTGPDASEFYILATQFGRTKNFDLRPGDSIWVDVVFKPTLAKPMPAKYADRHADLVASNHSSDPQEDDQIIAFTGTVKYAATTSTPSILNYGDVALGIVNSRSFLLCDTGTAPLIIKSFGPLTYPITGVSNLAPYDTIQPGGCKLVQIDMALTTYVDTSVVLNFVYQTNCPQPIPETLVIAASFINPTNPGHPFTPT
ncbi:MAG: hypothetical protein Q8916_07980, partial [Bacteroidota bacterium]|nr:hypothetical protein [Bacteroidota bacterium]